MTKKALMPPNDLKNLIVLSPYEFADRLATLAPGTQFTYHRGLLMRDRIYSTVLRSIADAAYTAWTESKVHLAQRRLESGACAYIAEVRPGPKPRHIEAR